MWSSTRRILLFSLFFFNFTATFVWSYERDQGDLDKGHVQDADKFRKTYFLNEEHELDLKKIRHMIARLQKERQEIANNSYESKLIDKIEIDLVDLDQAKKSARRQLSKEKNDLLFAFDQFLIPKIKELEMFATESQLANVDEKTKQYQANSLIDDFIRVYALFYYPSSKNNNPRNAWGNDYDHPSFLKRLSGYTFKKKDDNKIEANNLRVDTHQHQLVNDCLVPKVRLGHYLSPKEIAKLKNCGVDISKINPGKSPFWKPVTNEIRQVIRSEAKNKRFPSSEEKVIYKRIDYSGKESPKVKAYYIKNNKKIKIKIKVGFEVHNEQAASYLLKFAGFNQDAMRYYKHIKLYLGDTTLMEFFKMYQRRYRVELLPRYIVEKHDGPGEHWIVLKDVLVESHDPHLVRLGPYDFEGWDLLNRREHRGSMLFYAWLNLMEAVSDNYKMILKKGKGTFPEVSYRLHDPGYSLDRSFALRTLSDVSRIFAVNDRNVNMFSSSFLSFNEKKVKLWWNDYVFRNSKRFSTTTYLDLKWMARKIAAIAEDDIIHSLQRSGMPDDVIDLYYHKLRIRRNEMVKAFDLEKEFSLFVVPDLKEYSPNDNVQKGKIVKTHYDGHAEFQTRRTNFFITFLKIIGRSLSFFELSEKFNFKLNEAQLTTDINPIKVANSKLIPGISLTLGRRVIINPQHWNANGIGHGFAVLDTLTIEIGAGSDYFRKLSSSLPFSLQGHLRTFRIQLKMIHYADSRKEGYLSSFKLLKAVKDIQRFVAFELQPGEVVSRKDFYGIDLDFNVSVHNPGREIVNTELGGHIQYVDSSPIHYFRDHMGELHIYKEKSRIHSIGTALYILQLDLGMLSFPLIGIEGARRDYHYESELYTFDLPYYHENATALTLEQREKEYRVLTHLKQRKEYGALQSVMSGREDHWALLCNRKFSLKAVGKMTSHKFALLFLGNTKKSLGYSQVSLFLGSDENLRTFHRYHIERRDYKGFDRIPVPENEDLLIPKGNMYSINVELEEHAKPKIGVHLKIQDYLRKTTREGLLKFIADKNKLFFREKDDLFYATNTLPTKEEVDLYRKIYSDTNIYVSSEGVMTRLLALATDDVYHLAKKYNTHHFSLRSLRLKKRFNSLQREKDRPKAFVKHIGHFFSTLATRKYGIQMIKAFVGEENVHVYGQIYGVYKSFTMLQKSEIKSGLRYTAKSWGTFRELSPIRAVLKQRRWAPQHLFVDSLMEPAVFFGDLPMTRPPMF